MSKGKLFIIFILSILFISSVYALGNYPSIDPNMVAYLHFNNDSSKSESSTFMYDYSRLHNNNMSLNGGLQIQATGSILNDAHLKLDGINDFGRITDKKSLSPANNNLTISFWVKINHDNTCSGGSCQYIISKGGGSNYEYQVTRQNDSQGKKIVFGSYNLAGSVSKTVDLVSGYYNNRWYHVVVGFNTSSMYGYINGKFIGQNILPGMGDGTATFDVGNRGSASFAWFNGSIDELIIYNYSLKPVEVEELYYDYICSNVSVSDPDLRSHFKFDNSNEIPFISCDYSGHKNYGRFFNNISYSTQGISNGSMFLNGTFFYNSTASAYQGTREYLEMTRMKNIVKYNKPLTISYWLKPVSILPLQPTNFYSLFGSMTYQSVGMMLSSSLIYFGTRNTSASIREYSTSILYDDWVQYTFINNPNKNNIYIYKNGIYLTNRSSVNFDGTNYDFNIGHSGYSGNGQSLNAYIDEFKVYNKSLSAFDIYQSYYNTFYDNIIKVTNITVHDFINNINYSSKKINMNRLQMWIDFDDGLFLFGDKSYNVNSVSLHRLANYSNNSIMHKSVYFNVQNDGINDSYVKIVHNSNISFDLNDNLTYNFWINPKSYEYCNYAGLIIGKESSVGYPMSIRCGVNGLVAIIYNGSYNPNAGTLEVPTDRWSMVTFKYVRLNSTVSQIFNYLNGELISSKNLTIGGSLSNTADWKIGSRSSGGTIRSFQGYIDEIMIFNRNLPDNEILNLYGLHKFDSSIYGNNLTLNISIEKGTNYDDSFNFTWIYHDTIVKSGMGETSYNGIFNYDEPLYVRIDDGQGHNNTFIYYFNIQANPQVYIDSITDYEYITDFNKQLNYRYYSNYIDSCKYSLDYFPNNLSLNSCQNFTMSYNTTGYKELNLYINDTFGGLTKKTINFYIYNISNMCIKTERFSDINITYNNCNVTLRGKNIATFDGNSSYMVFSNSSFIQPVTNDFYISYWLKPHMLNKRKQTIYTKYSSKTGYGTYINSYNKSNILSYFYNDLGLEKGVGGLYVLDTDKWSYITLVKNNNYISIYEDGTLLSGSSYTGNLTRCNGCELTFGKTGNYDLFNGSIANFKINVGGLSSWEVKDLYERQSGTSSGYSVPILYGHYYDEYDSDPYSNLAITASQWLSLLQFLNNSGYNTINYLQYYAYRTNGTALPNKPIIINFDDLGVDDWLAMANVSARFGYIGNVNINTGSCNAACWAKLDTLYNHYNWYVGSHGQTHCHFGSGISGSVPRWCNTTTARAGNFSQAKQDIFINLGYEPISHVFPWNDYGVTLQEKQTIMQECASYYKICFGGGTSLPSMAIANDNTNLTDGSMRRSSFEAGVLNIQSNLDGLNQSLSNYQNDLGIFEPNFNNNLIDYSLNNFSGLGHSISYSTDPYLEIENDRGSGIETIYLSNVENYTLYRNGLYSRIIVEDLTLNVAPNESLKIYINSSSCDEAWDCTDWSLCSNNIQTRTCTDLSYCGTELSRPSESRSCQSAPSDSGGAAPSISDCGEGKITSECICENVKYNQGYCFSDKYYSEYEENILEPNENDFMKNFEQQTAIYLIFAVIVVLALVMFLGRR